MRTPRVHRLRGAPHAGGNGVAALNVARAGQAKAPDVRRRPTAKREGAGGGAAVAAASTKGYGVCRVVHGFLFPPFRMASPPPKFFSSLRRVCFGV